MANEEIPEGSNECFFVLASDGWPDGDSLQERKRKVMASQGVMRVTKGEREPPIYGERGYERPF